jgi:hypothetical protein
MAFAHSPKIVTDGMVFYYDTGNSKSYKGEPTTNFMPSIYYAGSGTSTGSDEIGDYIEGTVTRIGCPNGTPINSGSTYTFTIEIRADIAFTMSADSNQYSPENAGNDANRVSVSYVLPAYTDPGEWVTYSTTVVMKSGLTNPTMFDFFIPVNFTGRMYYRNAQLEYKDHPTQYTPGTRSATEGLLDFTKNATIDLTNVSFDSDALMTFDGSNDELQIDVDSWIRDVESVTIEGVVEIPAGASLAGGPWSIMTNQTDVTQRDGFWWHLRLGGGYTYFRVEDTVNGEQGITFGNPSSFSSGNTYHITTVVGNSGVYIYNNGVLVESYNPPFRWADISATNAATLFIGRTYPSYYLNSTNHLVKVYNRALTAEEIQQNYNTIKGRFGI